MPIRGGVFVSGFLTPHLWLLSLALCLTSGLHAQTYEWDGSSNNRWSTNANWTSSSSGIPDAIDATATLGSIITTQTTIGLRGDRTVGTLNIQGNQDFTLDRGNGGTRKLEFEVSTGSAQLNISGSNSSAINTTVETVLHDDLAITNTGTGVFTFQGVISQTGGNRAITVGGSGTTVFSGANSYAGATTVNGGTLRLTTANALGTTADGTAVNSGGALELAGGIAIPTAEALTLSGTGVSGGGALRNFSSNNTWNGNLTLSGTAEIENAAAGTTLTIGSTAFTETISTAGNTVTFDGPGDTFLNASITGSGGVIKNGGGLLTYYADQNTYTGATVIKDGTLSLDTVTGLNGAIAGTSVTVGDGSGTVGSAILRNGALVGPVANEMINNSATVGINRDGLWNLNNQNETVSALVMTGGQVTTGTGQLTLTASTPVTTLASADTASISGNLRLDGGGTKVFQVADGAAATDLSLSANISEPYYTSIQKTGLGTMVLSGSNTFTGDWTVSNGVLVAASSGALGSAATYNNTVASGAALQLSGGIALTDSNVYLSGTGTDGSGALRNLSGTNSWAGTVTLSAASTLTADAGSTLDLNGALALNNTLTVGGSGNILASGSAYGAGAILKTGAGTLTLDGTGSISNAGGLTINEGTVALAKSPGANTFTGGSLTVGDGTGTDTLRLDAANQIADYQSVTVNSSGLFQLNNNNETIAGLNMTGGNVTTGSGTLTLGSASALTTSASGTTATVAGNVNLTPFASTFNVADGAAAVDAEISGPVSGSANLIKSGNGTLRLSGTTANTRTGSTSVTAGTLELAKTSGVNAVAGSSLTINSGGTLLLSNSDQIADSTALTLAGGSFSTGAGYSETLGTLTLTGSSEIDLGSISHLLQFSNSSALAWSGSLTIYGWMGVAYNPGTAGRIFFGNSTASLTSGQLSMISFDGFGPGAILLSSGELVPVAVPEAGTILAALLLLLTVLWREKQHLLTCGSRFIRSRSTSSDILTFGEKS